MKCNACGAPLDDDAVFCSQCGRKIEAPEDVIEAAAVPEPVDESAGVYEEVKDMVSADEPADEPAEPEIEPSDAVAAIDEALESLSMNAEEGIPEEVVVWDDAPAHIPHDIPLPEPEEAPAPEPVKAPEEPVYEQSAEPEPAPVREEVPPLVKAPAYEAPPAYNEPPAYDAPPAYGAPPVYNEQPGYGAPPAYEPQGGYRAPEPMNEPYNEPVPAAAPERTKVGALRITGASLIGVFAMIFLILLSLAFCVKLGVSGDILKKRTENMDINTVLDADYKGKSLSDAIYNEAGFGDASHGKVSKSEFRTYLSQTDLLEYTAGYIKDYTDYIMIGDSADPSVNANDLADFFVNNSEVADANFQYKMKMSDYNKIRSTFDEKGTADNFSLDEWGEEINFRLENTNFIFSYVTLGIVLGLVLVLLIWIIVAVDKRGKHVTALYGSIFTWSGLVVTLVGLAVVAGASIAHVITGEFIFYLCASLLLPFGVFALCVGAGELLIGFIFKRIRRGIRNKEKRNKAVEKALAGTAV